MKKLIAICKILFLAVFWAAPGSLCAQYDCSIKHFTTNNGFPDNEVTTLSMDYDGYLWIGTYTSLVRYDGTSFKKFVFEKEGGYKNIMMYAMPLPADKKLMIKTRTPVVYTIEKGKPVLYSDTGTYVNSSNWTFLKGNFSTAALYKKQYQSVFGYYPSVMDELFILPVNKKDFIIGDGGNGVYYIRDGVKQPIITTGIKKMKMFMVSKNNRFLLDKENNLHLYDSASNLFRKATMDWQAIQTKEAAIIEARFFSDPYSGESFCSYNSSFYLLDYDARQNQVKFIPQFFFNNKKHFWTYVVYDNLHSTFFLSTATDGFFQVKLKKIQTLNINDRLPKNTDEGSAVMYSVVKTSDSTAVIPTGFLFTATASGVAIKKLGKVGGARETIAVLKDGSILMAWLGYYSPKDGYNTYQIFNDSLYRNFFKTQIQMLYPEGDSIWASSNDQVACFTKKKIALLFDGIKNKADSDHCQLHFFYRLNKDEAFVSNVFGLYRLHTTSPYKMEAVPELKDYLVHDISVYEDALILSVFHYGLSVYKDGKFYKVPVPEDQPGLTKCNAMYIDQQGYLWISTEKGLYKTLASSVLEAAFNKASIPFFFYYGNEDGIENTQFTGSGFPPAAVLRGERVLFPSFGGMVSFKPQELDNKIISSPVLIEKITVDNKDTTEQNDSIRLHADFKYLVIDLSAPNFGDAKNLSIEYMLDSKHWIKIPVADNLKITLVNIMSGDHELYIRKRTGFGDKDYAYTKLIIYKEKSIFEQVWFYLLLVIAVVALFFISIKIKTRNINNKRLYLQKRVNEQTAELSKAVEVKDLLISIISHDMVAPLQHVSMVAKVLKMGLESDPLKATQALSDIEKTSNKILSGSKTILDWMKYNTKKVPVEKTTIHLHTIIDETMEVYIPIAAIKNIILINEVSTSRFVEADHNILSTIFTNLISNAVKYTDAGNVRVFTEQEDAVTGTVLKISDTGKGMNEQRLNKVREVLKGNLPFIKSSGSSSGLGYVMVSELMKIHHLYATVESEEDKGTTVSVFIDAIM